MAGLLSAGQITALESVQAQLKTDADSIQGVLNSLGETPENKRRNAFHGLVAVYDAMVEAIVQAEGVVVRNEDAYK